MPIERVGTVCIFVRDQDRAREFYVGRLGMEVRADEPVRPGETNRWLAVAPKGADTEIILYLPDEHWEHYQPVVGKSQALTLQVDNLDKLKKDLEKKEVRFIHDPEKHPYGKYAMIEDSEGNHIILIEPNKHHKPPK